MGAAMEQDEEEWREEEEASSAVETGCCSSQSIPVFAHALSLLNSFPTPPHDTLFSAVPNPEEPAEEATGILACGSVQQEQHQNGQQQQQQQQQPQQQQIPVEPCARNEEDKTKSNTHNSSSEQHKKIRSKNWTRLEMLKLVRLRTDYEPKFAGGGKKMELWDEISEGLNREGISRDGQQCRDKWEKLCAGYKDVRDGSKLKEDFAMFDVLHPLLSGKIASKKMIEINSKGNGSQQDDQHCDHQQNAATTTTVFENFYEDEVLDGSGGNAGAAASARAAPASRKKRKLLKYVPLTDVAVVQNLLENLVARQQRFFRDLLESMERREQIREQIRQEREEQWRAEDRAQRNAFNNAMICLTQKLVGDNKGGSLNLGLNNLQQQQYGKNNHSNLQHQQNSSLQQPVEGVKKRSKNWKRAEVLQLIKLRGEMESQFSSGTRKTAVWDELSELLMAQGISRDGKQCREKWDKLTAAYKDVTDGVKDSADMPYFAELSIALRKPGNLDESKTSQQQLVPPAPVAPEEVLTGTEVLNGGQQALPVDCR